MGKNENTRKILSYPVEITSASSMPKRREWAKEGGKTLSLKFNLDGLTNILIIVKKLILN